VTRRIVLLLLSLGFSLSPFALPASSPEEKYRKAMSLLVGNNPSLEDRDDALNLLRSAADQGFAPAQTALGTAYELGTLSSADIQRAIDWYNKAADQGEWIAQFSLGRIYFYGFGVPRDAAAARKWFALAAVSGGGASAYYLGRLFDEGEQAADYSQAAKWYRQSAEKGNPFAQERLGQLWLKGLVGSGSRQEAYAWLLVAVEFGNSHALQALQSMEGDIGKSGADAARRQALEIRDRVLVYRERACGPWDGQYADLPTPPPLALQFSCRAMNPGSAAD
jgi:TPR repeat protein